MIVIIIITVVLLKLCNQAQYRTEEEQTVHSPQVQLYVDIGFAPKVIIDALASTASASSNLMYCKLCLDSN